MLRGGKIRGASGAEGLDHIVFSDDMVVVAVVFAQYCSIFTIDEAAQSFQWGVEGDNGIGFFQHFTYLPAFEVSAVGHHAGEKPAFANGTDYIVVLQYGKIVDVVFLHQFKRFGNGLPGAGSDQSFGAAAGYDILEGLDGHESPFHHPLIVINFTYIATSVIVQDDDYQIVFFQAIF